MVRQNYSNIRFDHFIDVTSSDCVLGTAKEQNTGRTKVFLIFNNGPIYARNGLKGTWESISAQENSWIRRHVASALQKNVPVYSTDSERVLC